jgi:microcystin-dependent protein
MSVLQVVNQGEEAFLDLILAVNYTLKLYQNNVESGLTETQKNALTESSFTEATFTGYSSKALTGGSWVTTPSDPSTGTYAQQTFTRTSTGTAQLIYGYYIVKTTGGALQWYEHFDGPVSIEFNGDALRVTPSITLDEGTTVPTGQITAFGGTAAPTGWLLCDGSAVSRTTFAALFAVLGTAFGSGDGSTTFNVPDLRQRFPLGKATSGTGSTLGGTGGTIDHTHALDTATSHAQLFATGSGTAGIHFNRKTVASWTENILYTATGQAVTTPSNSQTLGATLGGSSGTANAPFQSVNFIVKT